MTSRDSVPMTHEHKERLIRNLPTLVSCLKLSTPFWAILMGLLVLTFSDKQEIERAGLTDEDRVMTLVEHLTKKSDECYFSFLRAVRETRQHHLVRILQDEDAEPAPKTKPHQEPTPGLSLRDLQLTIVTSTLRLCSTVETWTWAADKVYVPLGQIFTDLVLAEDKGHTSLRNYTEMFKNEEDRPATFVFLQGLAGSGKSTLVQMLNVKWCRTIQRKWLDRKVELSEQEIQLFSKFNYVILIFMQHINQGHTLQDVIERQYCLGSEKAGILISKLMQYPEESLIFLEGYSEYIESTSPEITDIAHRKIFREATVVITSRHSPSYHFPDQLDRTFKPEKNILLRGFNLAGVSQYINNYFHKLDKGKADPLFTKIKQSAELLNLSSYPAILLLMCTLWKHEGSLSDSITGVFLKFVAYVCERFECKYVKTSQRAISRNIIQKYNDCLMKIGEVNVGGLREEKLKRSFLYKEVINQIGETAWQMGFFKRENNMEGEELVVFPHKIIQEFFTAYYVVNCDKSKQKILLIRFCSTIQAVKESKMILTFISGLGGEEIMKEINQIIQGSDESRDKIIPELQLICLAENRNAQLKLPDRVYLEVTDRYREEVFKLYLDNDCTAVTQLCVYAEGYHSISDSAVIPAIANMSQLAELKVGAYSVSASGLGSLCHVFYTHSPPLTTLDLSRAEEQGVHSAPWPMLMRRLPVTLQRLDVSNNKITDESVLRLSQRLPRLNQIRAIFMTSCNLRDPEAVSELIKNSAHCPNLAEICVPDNYLGDGLVELLYLTGDMKSIRKLWLNNNNLSDLVLNRIRRQLRRDLPQLELEL